MAEKRERERPIIGPVPLEVLHSLDLRVTISIVKTTRDLHMTRALELFNKTNQFNTTGVRYSLTVSPEK